MSENENKIIQTLQGVVVSNKMDKSIVVKIERRVRHPVYGKVVRRSTKIHAHDPENQCNVGDFVQLRTCRPIAKTKRWVLDKLLEKAIGEEG